MTTTLVRLRLVFCASLVIGLMHLWVLLAFADPKALVPQTGATLCVDAFGPIFCAGTGQDGDVQAGVALPTPRFKDNRDGTVTDRLTNLRWLKDLNCLGMPSWSEGFTRIAYLNTGVNFSCAEYTAGTFGDWRMPNINELLSLINYGFLAPAISNTQGNGKASEGNPFVNLPTSIDAHVKSSTPAAQPQPNTSSLWEVRISTGQSDVTSGGGLLWAVRGGRD
jgi:hypothetical protein